MDNNTKVENGVPHTISYNHTVFQNPEFDIHHRLFALFIYLSKEYYTRRLSDRLAV